METIIKGYIGTFFVALTLVMGMSIVSSSISQREANSMATVFATRIQAADFAQSEIDACASQAAAKDCGLTARVWDNEGRRLGELSFTYTFKLPILGYSQEREILVPMR